MIPKHDPMTHNNTFDVIIVGGSYAGLAAAMALGRALKNVLIVDDGKPCNRQTPYSHNFITHDGKTPIEILTLAKQQVQHYPTVMFYEGLAVSSSKINNEFQIEVNTGAAFNAKKLIFATGIQDIVPATDGYYECWGISVLHCPYCHGYEVQNERTGILGNGDHGFELAVLISNWTHDLTLFTNGPSSFTQAQRIKMERHHITIREKEIKTLDHRDGHLQNIIFNDTTTHAIKVLYTKSAFEQHCTIPQSLGCALTDEGYIKTDALQRTNIPGVYACGDNAARMRTVANAVGMGTTAGMMVSKEIIFEEF
jgi:thioredoxin reductase